MRSYASRRYHRLRRRGLCGQCGRVKSKTAICEDCRAQRKRTMALSNAGKTRCGACLQIGHNRRTCNQATPVRHEFHRAGNEHYRWNRAHGLCDRCGRLSATANCEACTLARKLVPSRQPAYVKAARGDRTREYARRNARRRKRARAQRRAA